MGMLRTGSEVMLQKTFLEMLCDGDFQTRRVAEVGMARSIKEFGTVGNLELTAYTIQKLEDSK